MANSFREFVGRTVVATLVDVMPRDKPNNTIVFDDGRGLTVGSSGSIRVETADEVKEAVTERKTAVEDLQRELGDIDAVLATAARDRVDEAPSDLGGQ